MECHDLAEVVGSKSMSGKSLMYFVTEDWYFVSHRLPLAVAARDAGYTVSVVTRVRDHGQHIEGAGLRLIPFEHTRGGINPLRELPTLLRLILLYRSERPDITHHVAMKPVLYGSIAARLAGTPLVVNALAGMGWLFSSHSGLARWLNPLVRLGLRNALRSGIALVQNPDDAHQLMRLGVRESRIRLIAGAGVDLQQFRPRPEPEGIPVVVLAARLLWDKGVGEFVSAARLVRNRGIAARFVLAGEPDSMNPASIPPDHISAWVREGVVEHVGWVRDMPRLLAESHIACLPSYREGLPKSLIEAAAAGLPIVTTDVPGCTHVVRNGENGILVPPGDSEALAQALERLIRDSTLRQRMGELGRIRAEREFALDKVIRETLMLYS